MIGRKRRRGLGAAGDILYGSVIDTGAGTKVDCRDWGSYLLNTGCWQLSHDAWNQVGAAYDAATYISPTVVPPAAPQTQPQMTGGVPWTPDIALAQTKTQQTAANQAWAAQVAANIAATQPQVPDCSGLNAITNTSCWPVSPGMMALILGGLAVVVLIRR